MTENPYKVTISTRNEEGEVLKVSSRFPTWGDAQDYLVAMLMVMEEKDRGMGYHTADYTEAVENTLDEDEENEIEGAVYNLGYELRRE